MINVLVATALASAAAAVAMAVLWLRARAAAQADAGALASELDEARRRVAALEARTWLDDFPTDAVFTLAAAGRVDAGGRERWHGVVRDEGGRVAPFLVERPLAHLAPGDTFTSVRGQLVKLDAAGAGAAPAAAGHEDATLLFDAAPAPAASPPPGGDGHEDVTVLFDPPAPAPEPAAAPGAAADERTVVAATGAPPEDDERTVFMAPGGAAKPRDPDAGLPYLSVIEGPDEGRRFAVPFSGASVGRESHNTVALSDGGASRVHCRIEYENNRFVLHDNNSTNGTLCNDERVTARELSFGDVVHVAETRMRFTCDGYELRGSDPGAAAHAFEQTLAREPDFVPALQNLAFLLEKDVARKKDAQPLWDRLARLQ